MSVSTSHHAAQPTTVVIMHSGLWLHSFAVCYKWHTRVCTRPQRQRVCTRDVPTMTSQLMKRTSDLCDKAHFAASFYF